MIITNDILLQFQFKKPIIDQLMISIPTYLRVYLYYNLPKTKRNFLKHFFFNSNLQSSEFQDSKVIIFETMEEEP